MRVMFCVAMFLQITSLTATIFGIVLGFMSGLVSGLLGLVFPPLAFVYSICWIFGHDLPGRITELVGF